MIIDFHTHMYPDEIAETTVEKMSSQAHLTPSTDGTLRGLLASMKENRVDRSVILPVLTKVTHFNSVNDFAARINERHEGKLTSFGAIHPDCPNYKACLRTLAGMGFKGIKLHPDFQGTYINDIRYKRIIAEASELGMTIVVHAGIDAGLPDPIHCPPKLSLEVIKEVAPPKLVLAHVGGYRMWDRVEMFLIGERVYFDLAFSMGAIPEEQLLRMIENHGAHKFLFGSDSPWMSVGDSIRAVEALPLTDSEKDSIFWKNAKTLLGI